MVEAHGWYQENTKAAAASDEAFSTAIIAASALKVMTDLHWPLVLMRANRVLLNSAITSCLVGSLSVAQQHRRRLESPDIDQDKL
jgi:DNA-binding GntR family transcriptional regulator